MGIEFTFLIEHLYYSVKLDNFIGTFMNKITILASLLLIFHIPIVAMNNDDEDDDIGDFDIKISHSKCDYYDPVAEDLRQNPHQTSSEYEQIYMSDFFEPVSKHTSKYIRPIAIQAIKNEKIQEYLKNINGFLQLHFLQINLTEEEQSVIATLNLLQASEKEIGKEVILPFHRVTIPVNRSPLANNLGDKNNKQLNDNKHLMEKRLVQLKDLALSYKTKDKLDHLIKTYSKTITFSDKAKTMLKYKVKPEVENDIALHTRDTLILPITKFIHKKARDPNAHAKHAIKTLQLKIKSEEPHLQKIIDLKIKNDLLVKAQASKAQVKETEEEFINQMENTAEFLAKQETL